MVDLVSKADSLVHERDKLENEEHLNEGVYLKLITALILVTVKKLLREVMVATELTRRVETKPRPAPSHLNLHQALTSSGTPCVHKGFLIPPKRERD